MRCYLALVFFLLFSYFFANSNAVGTLYVNEILGNRGSHTVQVEDVTFQSNTLLVSSITGLGEEPVNIYNTVFQDGNIHISAGNLNTQYITATQYTIQGGLQVVDGSNKVVASFANNTGDVFIANSVTVGGNVNLANGVFTVEGATGITTVNGALNIYSDVSVGSLFSISAVDGSFTTSGAFRVGSSGIILGDSSPNQVSIIKQSSTGAIPTQGQNLQIIGQDGSAQGGSLIFEPGIPEGSAFGSYLGSILLGRDFPDNLYITRATLPTGDGANTYLLGQFAGGTGGSTAFVAGSGGIGGSVYLSPGCSPSGCGGIIIGYGSTEYQVATEIGRPILPNGLDGSATWIIGQSTTDTGNGGDLILNAGDGIVGGTLRLTTGSSNNGQNSGGVFLGTFLNQDLYFGRVTTNSEAGNGWTVFRGQDSLLGNGGDLTLRAGDASVGSNNIGKGGQLYLTPGLDGVSGNGWIIVGTESDPLTFVRPIALPTQSGQSTTILGAAGTSAGGNILFEAGSGTTAGGSVQLSAGSATAPFADGGTVTISGTPSTNTGSVSVGGSIGLIGSEIYLQAGSGDFGGDLIFTGGSSNGNPDGSNQGKIILTGFYATISETNLIFQQDSLTSAVLNIYDSTKPTTSLTISTNAELDAGVLQLNIADVRQRLLRGRQPTFIDQPLTQPWQNQQQAAAEAVRVYNRILLALASHGLVAVTFIERPVGPFQGFSLE